MQKYTTALICLSLCCVANFLSAQCPGLVLDVFANPTVYCDTPATINLVNNSTGPNASTASYEWINGGIPFDTTVGTVGLVHSVTTLGTVNYTVIATDTAGCQDTLDFTAEVFQSPTANFSFLPNFPCTGELVNFGNTSTNTQGGTSYAWDFGDGNSSNQENPAHAYALPGGNFTVTLIVTNPSGCADTTSQSINVLPSPEASFTPFPGSFCLLAADTFTTFTPTFVNNSLNGVSYVWDYGDGSPLDTTTSSGPLTHTYTTFGTFNVFLTVTAANGCIDTASFDLIFDRNPVANFTVLTPQTSGCAPFSFTPQSNNSLNATSYIWDFGDSTPVVITTSLTPPTHIYDSTGVYSVTLTAINRCDSSTSIYSPVTVIETPSLAFVMGTPPFCAPADVSFTNFSTGASPFNNYTWNFGRGPGDSLANVLIPPNQIYNQGFYNVTLTGTNGCGTSSLTLPLFVDSIPEANVIAAPVEGCTPLLPLVLNTTFPSPLSSHSWEIPLPLPLPPITAATYQFVPPPLLSLNDTTTYNINYTVTNLCGSDDTTIVVNVIEEAGAAFTASTFSICAGDSITFTDQSSGIVNNWNWDFGNGNTSTAQGPHTQQFNTPGFISVSLSAGNSFCDSIANLIIEVRPNPVASFDPVPDSACVPAAFNFTNNSSNNPLLLTFYDWTFGGGANPGTASGFSPPTVNFPNVGTHPVTLTVNQDGCIRSDTQEVVVMPLPTPGFTATPQDGCSPLTVAFNNTSGVTGGETWFWDFDDGTTSSLQNPGTHTFINAGTVDIVRNVTLTVTTDFGCVSSVSLPITIHPLPTAAFNAPNTVCLGEPVNFANTSIGGSTFNWDFGDGNTSTQASPSHAYTSTGNFTVQLISITGFGCRDTVSQTIQVDPIPTPNFQADTVCANTATSFTDLSTNAIGWQWNFGDGGTSNLQNPTHLYAVPGTFNVQLIVTNSVNCTDSITIQVIVNPNPVAGFTATAGACLGEIVPFTNTSTGATLFAWDFGDGNTSTQTDPSHAYGASGNFTVALVATNGFGCTDTFTQAIIIDTIPVPNFTADTVCLGETTTFTDLSTPPASVTAWIWDFGDGNGSNLQNPTHSYAAPGTYTVQLIATNTAACSDTIQQDVVVHPVPTATFNAPPVCLGETSIFIDQSTGAPVGYLWDFGDGNTSTQASPTHVYATANTFNVTLIVSNLEGCTDTLVQSHIVNEVPVASFTADTTCFGALTLFDATASLNAPNLFLWDFGDGNINNTNNATPTHLYAVPGTYTVTLVTGIAATGCTDTISLPVVVNETPVAAFVADTVCQGGLTSFSDLSTNNFPSQWNWDFGDGNGSNLENPTHLYGTDGTFTVTLIVSNALGCADTVINSVEVNPVPSAAFTAPNVCFGANSIFTDNSTGTPTTWNWDFGDGNTSTLENPTHLYAAPNTYTITLIATNTFGCADTVVGIHTVDPVPTAIFSADTVCFGDFTSFDATASIGSPNTYTWDFGDGNSDNTNNPTPSHTYGNAGTFTVTLIAGFVGTGCADTTTVDVIVRETPIAAFAADTVCLNLSTTFTDQSTNNFSNQWTWDFGDGNGSNLQNPSHLYGSAGTFNVQLTVENQFGCVDSVTVPVLVEPLPVAGFTVQPQACVGEAVSLANTSTGAANFNWDFGDGNSSTLQNPIHSYSAGGNFTITLIANTTSGCADTATGTIVVDTIPDANFAADTVCQGNLTTFTDLSSASVGTWIWDFGDGNTSVLENPTHLYATPGTFNVQLIVTDGPGCQDSISIPVLVNPNPVADFTAPPVCFSTFSQFTDNSTGSPTSFAWDFGDGNTSTQPSPSHLYGAPGNYTVTLIAFNTFGCSDTISLNHDVFPIPTAVFTADTVCFGNATSFDGSASLGGPDTFFWDFGDGNTDNTNNPTPTHNYATAGTFSVALIAGFNATGCVDTTTLDVIVRETPIPAFVADTVCLNLATTFTDQSTNNFSNNWTWDFGDGNNSAVQNPIHLYTTAGIFNVQLTVENTFGCIDSVTLPVVVEVLPIAGFTAQTQACVGEGVPFANTTVGGVSFAWDFGDGGTSTLQNPNYVYTGFGTFTAQLIASTGFGCTDTFTQSIVVDTIPLPNFIADTVCVGNATSFSDDTPGSINSWAWDFGDGNNSILQNPTHLYAAAGTYNVQLTVVDGPGCLDSITLPVLVNPIPTANFSAPPACFSSPSQFTSLSTGNPTIFDWDFGDGNTSNQQDPSHLYAAPGNYTVTLIVFSGVGCSDTISLNHDVFPIPTAIFTADTVCFGNATSFDASTSVGNPNTFFWDFGDGNTDNTNNPTPNHLYGSADTFTVTLVAGFAGSGCTDITTFDVLVRETPVATFLADTVCLNLTTTFINQSTNSFPDQWTWDFGDGNGSTQENPFHLYGTAGTFNVQLVVENTFGCIDSITNPVIVEPLPVAGFTAQIQACVGEVVPFPNTSTGAVGFNWDFGDGNSSTQQNPNHAYATGDTFTVELIVNTSFGCADTISQTIVVDTIPVPDFVADTVCVGDFTTFTDQSSMTVNTWDWDFGDGNTSNLQNPTHPYATAGNYNVQLTITDGPGCQDSITLPVLVNPIPTAGFTAPPVCFTSPSIFTNTSTGTPVSFDWDFGDGDTSNLQNPIHIYATPGNYTVTLIVFSGVGCSDTISLNHDVFPIPTAIFSADTVCFGNPTSFDATASIGSPNTYSWDYGDGNTDNTNNATPTHSYASAGTFTVSLIAGFAGTGCTDTTTVDVVVHETPVAIFAADTVCLNLITTFADQSTNTFPDQWTWDFGDGNGSNIPSPTHLYASDGTFSVQLVVENTFGCIDSVTNPVIVEPLPVAGFTAQGQACVGEVVPFTNTSTGGASFTWDFGDGNGSNLQSPTHAYTGGGTFTVELIANTGFGCADTISQVIVVDTIPIPNFVADTVCVGNATSFTDSSTGPPVNWVWDFGDGNGSNVQNPVHAYLNPGTFNVQLTITDAPGCQDSITLPVLVNPIPTAAFTAPAVCFTSPSIFTNNSTGTPVSFDWDFGDGAIDSVQNPTHVYAAPGNYTVTLIVFSGIGCSDTISLNHDVFPIPTAVFTADTVCFGNATSFDANASVGPPNTYFWDFGDGTTDNTNNPSPVHTYASADTFTVTLIAGFGATGCTDTRTLDVIVRETPVAIFVADTVCLNNATTFTDLSTNNFQDQWTWDFGDGNGSTQQSPSHLYAAPSTFNVQLIVENIFGCIDSVTNPVLIEPLPVAGFTAPAQGCVGEGIPFANTSTGATNYLWDFGDGNTSTATSPTHIYASPGNFTVELIALTGFGCRDTFTQAIALDTLPVPNFVADTVCIGGPTTFSDSSTGSVVSWDWDFGDGNTSNLQNPVHLYANPGIYNVQLIVMNPFGCTDSLTIPVEVYPEPTAGFLSPNVCFTSPSLFTDTSLGTPTVWDWDFGDSNGSNQQNPSHVYATPGTYQVTLIVFSGVGCSDTLTQAHTVHPIPTAVFTRDTVCFGDSTFFDAGTSIGSPDTYFWDFGDGTADSSNSVNLHHTYNAAGTYLATLVAGFSSTGCTDTTSLNVIVRETPVAIFQADTVCLNLTTTFMDQSVNNFPNTWAWDFGDGNGSTQQNPSHIYTTADTFPVQLIVENTFGCIDSLTQNVIVNPLPVAGFAFDTVCLNLPTNFTDLSVDAVAYDWDFGDGNGSAQASPSHVYAASGTYTVTQIVFNVFGCSDTLAQQVIVSPYPVADFGATTACFGYASEFSDSSTGNIVTWDWDFGDSMGTSIVPSPNYIYGDSGVFQVSLVVTNNFGCTDTASQPVTVLPIPVAGFTYPVVCAREVTQFQDTSLGLPSTWSWDFGDGSPLDTTQNPGHIYDPGGQYSVTLVAGNIFGCFDTLVAPVLVNTVPVPDFSALPICQGDVMQFNNLSTDTVINTLSYFWDFGDGNNSFVQDPGYVYADSGFFNVSLFTTNQHGCVDSITQPVYVAPAPQADFVATTVCLGEMTQFTDLSSPWVSGWAWDFGDGSTSNVQNPSHQFATSGNHTVTLVVFTSNSCVDTVVQNLNVQIRPEASFVSSPIQCSGEEIDFTSTSLNNPVVWAWDFGDGNTSPFENPSHSYGAAGIYTVTFIASTANACSDTATAVIEVFENPVADFMVDTVCLGIPTLFGNQSTGAVSYFWTFGNQSNSSNADQPGYIFFDTAGVYNVTLVATSLEGCSDTISQPAVVAAYPQAGFLSDPLIPSSMTTDDAFVNFTNISTGGLEYLWDFGDGNSSTDLDPDHTYTEPGTYCVSLIVTGLGGCQDSIELCDFEVGTGVPDLPNLFTPNGDGTNDNFVIRNISEFPNNSLTVFNRWGNKVYERRRYNNEWDGTNSANGNKLPDGGYFYIFKPGDGRDDVVGDVVIMR